MLVLILEKAPEFEGRAVSMAGPTDDNDARLLPETLPCSPRMWG